MVQVQSTWFPIIDRNPQKYVPNIFEAKESDYQAATEKGISFGWICQLYCAACNGVGQGFIS